MKKKISERTLKLIRKKRIKPIPRWEFAIRNWGIKIGLGICLVAMVIGAGIYWFGAREKTITANWWLVAVAGFLGLTYWLFEKTKKAYRWEKWQIVAGLIIVGLISGGLIYASGLAEKIDEDLESSVPYYRQVVPMKLETWVDPENGRLAGKIVRTTSTTSFELEDFNGKKWVINYQEALVRKRVKVVEGEEIKVIGQETEGQFEAKEIRPWGR